MTLPMLPALAFLVVGLVFGSLTTLVFVWSKPPPPAPRCLCPTPTTLPTTTTTTTTSKSAVVAVATACPTQRASTTKAIVEDERGFLCGYVDQEPIFFSVDPLNGEKRPWTRQRWIWYKNLGRLPRAWVELEQSIPQGDFHFASHGLMHKFSDLESNATYYCGLLPHNVLPWTVTFRSYEAWINASRAASSGAADAVSHSGQRAPFVAVPASRAPRYALADVAIGVYTSTRFLRTRAQAVRDTYLARHPANRVFYFTGGADPLGLFDVVEVPDVGERYESAFGKQMYALQHMWANANDAKWFYVIGCDTYVFMDYVLTMLDVYDADEPLILGCCAGDYPLANIGVTDHEKVFFASGGAGIFISRALMAKMIPAIPEFVAHVWPAGNPAVDVATAYLALRLGHRLKVVGNMFATLPEQALKYHHTGAEIENAVWHFLHPTKLFDMDEFHLNQKLDRLARMPTDIGAPLLLEFARSFLASHFHTLRRAYYERRVMAGMLGDSIQEVKYARDSEIFNKAQHAYLAKLAKTFNVSKPFWHPAEWA